MVFDLNHERAAEETRGHIRWLRSQHRYRNESAPFVGRLDTLVTVGQARQTDDGRYVA